MLVKLTAPVVALGVDGTVIELKQGEGPPPLRKIILHALRDVHFEMDQKQGPKEKLDRFLLEKRLDPSPYSDVVVAPPETLEMTEGEIKMVKERIGRIFLQAGIVGAACTLLDTTVAPPECGTSEAPVENRPPLALASRPPRLKKQRG